MFKKVLIIGGIVIGVVCSTLFIVSLADYFTDMAAVAHNGVDPVTAGNYTFYMAAVKASPLFIVAVPIIVGGIAIFLLLRTKRQRQ
jgi:hypothetical protein